MITFSNPRLTATFEDWPLGGNKRGKCTFTAEHRPNKGWRVSRVTTGKPKTTTYCQKLAIVDGSNGKTYILEATPYNMIGIVRSDFMSATREELGEEKHGAHTVVPSDANYQTLMDLINAAV